VKFVTLLLLILAVQGCATLPHGVAPAGEARQITWTRGVESAPFEDQNGVCHTFSRDTPAALQALGSQVKACFERALPVMATASARERGVKVMWQRVAVARIDALFAESASQSVLHAAGGRKAATPFAVRGFYVQRDDACVVVVSDHAGYLVTLGHEFKHCIDGEYHDERGVWRQYRAG
jgi:hypothetical protein